MFERLIVHLDEPFADVSLFPTFSVSELAREHVKVVLSGDGGDELFGGYDAYQAQALAAKLRWMGDALMPALAGVGVGAAADREEEGPRQQGQALQRRRHDGAGRSRSLSLDGAISARARRRSSTTPACATRSAPTTSMRRCATRSAAFSQDDVLNRQLYADLSLYLADDILVKVDRMSMATSLETRAPFLDGDLMELAFSMPGHLKIRNGERKWILKQAMKGVLPDRSSIARRRASASR